MNDAPKLQSTCNGLVAVAFGLILLFFQLLTYLFVWSLGAGLSGTNGSFTLVATLLSFSFTSLAAYLVLRRIDAVSAALFVAGLTVAAILAGDEHNAVAIWITIFGVALAMSLFGLGLILRRGKILPCLNREKPMYLNPTYLVVFAAVLTAELYYIFSTN